MDLGILSPFYADDAAFDGSAQQSAQLLKLIMDRGIDRGYFHEPDNSLFILDTPGQEEASKRYFEVEVLEINFVGGGRYLGAYIGPQEELEVWVKIQVEAWDHGVRVLGQIYQ